MVLPFGVETVQEGGAPILRVCGEVDVHTAPQLKEALAQMAAESGYGFVVSLAGVSYVDSTGLGTIAQLARSAGKMDQRIFLVATSPHVLKVLEVSGITQKNVVVCASESEAVQQLVGQRA